jgi:excisionase family DNA binding protein
MRDSHYGARLASGMNVVTYEQARRVLDAGQVLRPAEVGVLFGVDVRAVARWADTNKVPSFRTPGGHRRFKAEDIRKAIREGVDAPQ